MRIRTHLTNGRMLLDMQRGTVITGCLHTTSTPHTDKRVKTQLNTLTPNGSETGVNAPSCNRYNRNTVLLAQIRTMGLVNIGNLT